MRNTETYNTLQKTPLLLLPTLNFFGRAAPPPPSNDIFFWLVGFTLFKIY